MPIKFLLFLGGGGGSGFCSRGGVGSANLIFMGVGIFPTIEEGFKGVSFVEAPKSHLAPFSGLFGSDSGGLPGCNFDFWPVIPTLACNSDFRAETRIILLKFTPESLPGDHFEIS